MEKWKTREVMVGNVGVGGDNPIRVQSMTTSSTRDVEATVKQAIRLYETGCEIVRVTVQGIKEADACEEIKNELVKRGYDIPLVADIHFYPPAAMRVADSVDKIRVNPGNFVDKRATFKEIIYNDKTYQEELDKIEEKFSPLVEKCKRLKRSMRIGTNHGSLSDRIMNYYGDSPKGMVESALEFARVCRGLDYHDIIFSMKASNPVVMIEAYRLLVAEMKQLGWDYPLHLGVTEAGEGEDGRIKSAIGIGTLLLEGIGDTIRVSLTEDPWHEIEPCQRLIDCATKYAVETENPSQVEKREVGYPKNIALHKDGSVFLLVEEEDILENDFYQNLGLKVELGRPKLDRASVDSIVLERTPKSEEAHKKLTHLMEIGVSVLSKESVHGAIPLVPLKKSALNRFSIESVPLVVEVIDEFYWDHIVKDKPALILLNPRAQKVPFARKFFQWMKSKGLKIPVILAFEYDVSEEQFVIDAAAECGALLSDKLGEGLLLKGPYALSALKNYSFNLLQGARMRTIKTEFISCPSCGRTLFNLQEVSKEIRERTSHLPGVKIAIMGCIVNGPGEMADADFGYVGSKPGMIDLYVGKERVEKNIPFNDGPDKLVELLKEHNRWEEPTQKASA